MSYKSRFAIAIAIFLWASAFVGIRAGLKGYSPEGLALLRFLIASICMGFVYFNMSNRSTMKILDVCALMCVGAFGIGVYNITLNYGELSISSGMASFIISQSPIITVMFAIVFLGERLDIWRVSGFIVSILGVALITIGERSGFKWDDSIAYILIATLAGGLYSILQKPFLKKYHAIEATTYIIWGAAIFLSIYVPNLQHDLQHASLSSTLTVAYLGVFPAAIAYMAWGYALAEIPASRAMSFLYFTPFVATLLGWIWLGETPVGTSLMGGLLAIVGVYLVNQSYRKTRLQA
jgi:drug/metabolite transporter (DMT)-like permease